MCLCSNMQVTSGDSQGAASTHVTSLMQPVFIVWTTRLTTFHFVQSLCLVVQKLPNGRLLFCTLCMAVSEVLAYPGICMENIQYSGTPMHMHTVCMRLFTYTDTQNPNLIRP